MHPDGVPNPRAFFFVFFVFFFFFFFFFFSLFSGASWLVALCGICGCKDKCLSDDGNESGRKQGVDNPTCEDNPNASSVSLSTVPLAHHDSHTAMCIYVLQQTNSPGLKRTASVSRPGKLPQATWKSTGPPSKNRKNSERSSLGLTPKAPRGDALATCGCICW